MKIGKPKTRPLDSKKQEKDKSRKLNLAIKILMTMFFIN